MVGLCGVIGPDRRGRDRLGGPLVSRGHETSLTYAGDQFSVILASHSADDRSITAWSSDGDVGFWLWGDVWGFEPSTVGGDRLSTGSPADFCASLYEDRGFDFVSGLNGSFVGVAYDRPAGEVTFFTDRFGTRPLHYVQTDDSVVFSTDIQSLQRHPSVEIEFDLDYLAEYLALKRSFGVKTPLSGVERLQPSSLTTVSAADLDVRVERYWRPRHRPRQRSSAHFAARLADIIERAAHERTDPDTSCGLLLSGGSDSRLTLAALTNAGRSVHAFHVNDWYNREARIAHRAAQAVGADFTFLRRDEDYQARALAKNSELSLFGGFFNQIHAAGFEDTITDEVDVLFTGHYGDMLFKGNHLPTPTVDFGRLGSFSIPFESTITTVDGFVDHRVVEAPAYLTDALERPVHEIYAANVKRRGSRIVDHGVEYESLREALLCSRFPLTNGTSHFFYYGTLQMMPSGTLFLDNRLVDLFLTIPIDILLRGNLVNRAVERLGPELADIPHGNTGIALNAPPEHHWIGDLATSVKDRYTRPTEADPHWTQGPWPNHVKLVRTHDFLRRSLNEHEDLIRSLPFLSWDGVNECYESHMNGQDKLKELYTLVTFLNMPVVEQFRAPRAEDPCSSSGGTAREGGPNTPPTPGRPS